MGEFGDEGSVEVAETKEASDIFYGEWRRPFSDALYFHRVHFYFPLSNDDPEVFDFFLVKLAFLGFQKEVMLCKFVEEVVDLFAMFFGVIGHGNYGVVHVDAKPSLGDFIQEDLIHHSLEGRQQVH